MTTIGFLLSALTKLLILLSMATAGVVGGAVGVAGVFAWLVARKGRRSS